MPGTSDVRARQKIPGRAPPLALLLLLLSLDVVRSAWALAPSVDAAATWQGGAVATQPRRLDGAHPTYAQVDCFFEHCCGLKSSGEVRCWGRNGLVVPSTAIRRSVATPVQAGITAESDVVSVHVGEDHTCVVMGIGQVLCWGNNRHGQCTGTNAGNGLYLSPQTVAGLSSVDTMAAGLDHNCALQQGEVLCWGRNTEYQSLPRSDQGSVATSQLSSMPQAMGVRAGIQHSCAIAGNGSVYCWGYGASTGRLGTGSAVARVPTLLALPPVVDLAIGYSHSCAVARDTALWCWGQGGQNQLTAAYPGVEHSPVQLPGMSGFSAVDVGDGMTCALSQQGSVVCFGHAAEGRTGTGVEVFSGSVGPTVLNMPACSALALGSTSGCALGQSGDVYCWGARKQGVVGGGEEFFSASFQSVEGLAQVAQVSHGEAHVCAVNQLAELYCWGENAQGQLGLGDDAARSVPGLVQGLPVLSVAAGSTHTCAVSTAGVLYCWGENMSSQLGTGESGRQMAPAAVATTGNFSEVATGRRFSCARAANGTVYCWGGNEHGQCGIGTSPAVVPLPTQVALSEAALQISVTWLHSCALLATHEVYCWGLERNGRIGGSDANGFPRAVNYRHPEIEQASALQASQISVGRYANCALLLSSSAVYCWGKGNLMGAPGVDTAVAESKLEIAAAAVTVGYDQACALTSDNLLFCWGEGVYGVFAATDSTVSNVVQVGTAAYLGVSLGASSLCAITLTNSVECRGLNDRGQLGHGSRIVQPSPSVLAGTYMTVASTLLDCDFDFCPEYFRLQMKLSAPIPSADIDVGQLGTGCGDATLLTTGTSDTVMVRCKSLVSAGSALVYYSAATVQRRLIDAGSLVYFGRGCGVCTARVFLFDSDNRMLTKEEQGSDASTIRAVFSCLVSSLQYSDVHYNGAALAGFWSCEGDADVSTCTMTGVPLALSPPHVITFPNASALGSAGEATQFVTAGWPLRVAQVFVTNCSLDANMSWPLPAEVSEQGSCVAWEAEARHAFDKLALPVGVVQVLVHATYDMVRGNCLSASSMLQSGSGIHWADEHFTCASSPGSLRHYIWRRISSASSSGVAQLTLFPPMPADSCVEFPYADPRTIRLAPTVLHALQIKSLVRQGNDAVQVVASMALQQPGLASLPDLAVNLLQGGSPRACEQPEWLEPLQTVTCSVTGLHYAGVRLHVTALGSEYVGRDTSQFESQAQVYTTWPAAVYRASAASTRLVDVWISGAGFPTFGQDVEALTLISGVTDVSCQARSVVSSTAIRCAALAQDFKLLPYLAQVTMPHQAWASPVSVGARTTTATEFSLAGQFDAHPPQGVFAPLVVPTNSNASYDLSSTVFDNVCSASSMTVFVHAITASPSAMLAEWTLPEIGKFMSLQALRINVSHASIRGTLAIELDVKDDSSKALSGTITISVIDSVGGTLRAAGGASAAASPVHTPNDTVCAVATFDSPVVGITADDWLLQARHLVNRSVLVGWHPAAVVLRNFTAGLSSSLYEFCMAASELPSAVSIELQLPTGAGTAEDSANVLTAGLAMEFVRDTVPPWLPGKMCAVVNASADSARFGAGLAWRCTMAPELVHDDVDPASEVQLAAVSIVSAVGAGSLSILPGPGASPVLATMPVLAGYFELPQQATVQAVLRDRAGNAGVWNFTLPIWDPLGWPPQVHSVTPAHLPADGGLVLIHGANFTAFSPAVEAVDIGGLPCEGPVTLSDAAVRCKAPAGLGANVSVAVKLLGNITATKLAAVSYEVPKISAVQALPGGTLTLLGVDGPAPGAAASVGAQRVHISCSACGTSAAVVTSVLVGGRPCTGVQRGESNDINCALPAAQHASLALNASGTTAVPQRTDAGLYAQVVICIANQCSLPAQLGVQGRPIITGLSLPRTGDNVWVVQAGDLVTVNGRHFGRQTADIMTVTVGGQQATSVTLASSSVLQFVVPAAGAVHTHAQVLASTAAGWTTAASANSAVTYKQAYLQARAPRLELQNLTVARRPEDRKSWDVALSLPADPALALVPATDIVLRWRDLAAAAAGQPAWSPGLRLDWGTFSAVQANDDSPARRLDAQASARVYARVDDPMLPAGGVQVAVAVQNAGGVGPWTDAGLLQAALPPVGVVQVTAARVYGETGVVDLWLDVPDAPELDAYPLKQIRVHYLTQGQLQAAGVMNGSTPAMLQLLQSSGSTMLLQVSDLAVRPVAGNTAKRYTARLERVTPSPVYFTAQLITAAGTLDSQVLSSVLYDVCTADQYLSTQYAARSPDAVVCTACPTGAWCGGGTYDTLLPLAGWYRLQWTPHAMSFQECLVAQACLGVPQREADAVGSNRTAAAELTRKYALSLASHMIVGASAALPDVDADTRCSKGYSGTLCRGCALKYSQSSVDGTCRPCKSRALHFFLLILGVLIVCAGIGYLILSTIRVGLTEDDTLTNGLKKLLISHNQQVSLAVGFQFQWPDAVAKLLSGMDMVSNVSDSVLAVDCLVDNGGLTSFRLRMVLVLVIPLLLMAVVASAWLLAFWEARRGCCGHLWWTLCPCLRSSTAPSSAGPAARPAHSMHNLEQVRQLGNRSASKSKPSATARAGVGAAHDASRAVITRGSTISRGKLSQWRYIRTYLVVSGVVVCFALHTSVTKASLRQFSCISLRNDPTSMQVLQDDYDVECTSEENIGWIFGLGIPGFVLYGIGMPVLLWYLLWRRRAKLQLTETKAELGFLYASYRPHAWYFESVIMLRKAMLAVVSVNLAPLGLRMQTYAAILLLFGALLLHLNLRPMASAYLQRMEQSSLVISVITLLGGLFLGASDSHGIAVVVSIVIVGSNAAFMAYLVGKLVTMYVGQRRLTQLGQRIAKAGRTWKARPNMSLGSGEPQQQQQRGDTDAETGSMAALTVALQCEQNPLFAPRKARRSSSFTAFAASRDSSPPGVFPAPDDME